MASGAIAGRTEPYREIAVVLPPEHEMFAVHVASGRSYRESARLAGFHEDNGFRLMQMPAVRDRVEELVNQPQERIRAGIDAEFLMLRNRAADQDLDAEMRANIELRLKLVMGHARYLGLIVEKKQVAHATLNLGNVSRAAIRAEAGRMLDELEPGARAELQRMIGADAVRQSAETPARRTPPVLPLGNMLGS